MNYPLILDCDTGEDDAIAIVLAIMSNLPLKYIVTCHGNTTLDNATRNSSRIVSLLNNSSIKIIKGSKKPYKPHKYEAEGFTAGSDFLGKNGICDIELPESQYNNIIDPGHEKCIEELAQAIKKEGKVDYIITGPCTNFARLCELMGDEIKKYINSLTIMGGAIYVKGTRAPGGVKNTSHEKIDGVPETWAEFNYYCDPEAVKKVLSMNLNPTIVTWDVCMNFELPIEYINKMKADQPGNKFIVELMQAFMKMYGIKNKTKFELCDPLTIMAYMGYGNKKDDKITINTEDPYYAKSYHDDNGYSVQYFYPKSSEEIKSITEEMMKKLQIEVK